MALWQIGEELGRCLMYLSNAGQILVGAVTNGNSPTDKKKELCLIFESWR